MREIPFKLLLSILVLLLLVLQYKLWFDAGGIKNSIQLKKQLAQQQQENTVLKQHNDELSHQVNYMQANPDAIESRARRELGMIKKNETFYQVMK